MNKNSQVLKQTIPYLFAFLGCLGIRGIMATSADITYTNSFFAILFFGISVYLQNRIIPDFLNAKKREKVCSVILALFISVALHLGAQFESNDSAELAAKELVICTISFAIYMTPIINACFEGVKNFFSKKKVVSEERVNFLKVWLAIFGLWIPTFLAMYPGAFVYDATDEYNEVLNGVYNTHHPLIHVLSLGGLIRCTEKMGLGANAGIATYTIFQMIITSLIFAYVLKKCFEWGMSKRYVKVWVVIIGLFPVFTLYSVCSAKDTLFSACFLLVIVFITEFIKTEKIKVGLIVASVFMMLLRNNGAYAYLVSIPVILIILCVSDKNKKKTYLKLGGVMICSLLVYKGTEKLIIYATGASNNEHQEMLTVPIQQLGRVYNFAPETLNDEDKALLEEFIPQNYLITYNSKISDVIKSGFNNQAYEEKGSEFVSLWIRTGLKKPFIYVNAWLANNYGYWYPDMIINVYGGLPMYTFSYVDSSYFGFETEPPGKRHSLIPIYEEFYRNISLELFQQRVPVLSMLFSPGFMFYIFAFVFVYLIREKRLKYLAVLIPVLLLWATVLLGPTVLVRYVLILWYILPVLPVYLKDNNG